MSAREEIVIIGAGAIGRGYLPWIFPEGRYDLVFVDTNPRIVERMRHQGAFSTFRVVGQGDDLRYEERRVPVAGAYLPAEFHRDDWSRTRAVFVNVGPRHAARAAALAEGSDCPVILCENDPATVESVKAATTLTKVFFAVPDVITSNTAPRDILARDPLAIATESGVQFMDDRVEGLEGDFTLLPYDALLHQQWTAKLYLHNTPHCVAAYLGALAGVEYVHEAMAIPEAAQIVEGCMEEMLSSLKLRWEIPHDFLEWYAEKELSRFRSRLLFDPIARVAREPLRKLEADGRLVGAAQICMSMGFVPQNILIGIASAILFDDENDADHHIQFMRRALSTSAFLTHVLTLRKGEALERVLGERFPGIVARLDEIPRRARGAK